MKTKSQSPIVIRNVRSVIVVYKPEITVDVTSRESIRLDDVIILKGKLFSMLILPVKDIQNPINPIMATPATIFRYEK